MLSDQFLGIRVLQGLLLELVVHRVQISCVQQLRHPPPNTIACGGAAGPRDGRLHLICMGKMGIFTAVSFQTASLMVGIEQAGRSMIGTLWAYCSHSMTRIPWARWAPLMIGILWPCWANSMMGILWTRWANMIGIL